MFYGAPALSIGAAKLAHHNLPARTAPSPTQLRRLPSADHPHFAASGYECDRGKVMAGRHGEAGVRVSSADRFQAGEARQRVACWSHLVRNRASRVYSSISTSFLWPFVLSIIIAVVSDSWPIPYFGRTMSRK